MRCLSIALILLCVHCSSQPAPASPAGEAPSTEPAAATPPAAAEPTSAPSAQPSAVPSSQPAAGALKNPPKKQPCEKLDKSTCKVMVGCAWNDKQKCTTEETH